MEREWKKGKREREMWGERQKKGKVCVCVRER